ncbi:MAG: hypothetical protein AAFW89_04280 [Bacteroidota bacterium]
MANKPALIAILLLIACLICSVLLVLPTQVTHKKAISHTQLDSLIVRSLYLADIAPSSISEYVVQVDSTFSRSVFRVKVPQDFHSTSFHLILREKLKPYPVSTQAKIRFPENETTIFLYVEPTVIRSIQIKRQES